jgi:light-regulated signal transduction histidine kinase (bacteriophytochrome)
MPGLGGRETCRRIKSAPVVRDIPLVILTGNEDRAAMVEGLAAGADDYIVKSADLPVLKARVRAQLRRKQFEDETRHIREQRLRKELEATEARAASELAEARAVFTEELARKNKELEAFSYSVAHDLRAPVRAIDGFSAILEEDHGGQLDDQGRDYVKRIRSATKRMSALIEDLIKLARVTGTDIVVQRVDLQPLVETILRELRERTPERSVDARIGGDLVVHGDPGLLHTVLENLVGNAWKFTSKRADAVIEIGRAGPTIFVRVNGVGFDQSHAETVFQPFQRLHAASQFEGTGIGLATVQRIIARHGGRIWAEGAIDRGATVYFTLDGGE